MNNATFLSPDLTTFCHLDGLGLEVTGQCLYSDRAVTACRVVEPDEWCRTFGAQGVPRDTVTRELGHEPFGWRPTILLVRLRRYRCPECGYVWRQDTTKAAEPRAKLSRRGLRRALEGIVSQHLTVARVAEGLGVSWNTANKAVLAEGRRVLIDDVDRFSGVKIIGVDEHVWRHTRNGDKYVTVIIDLTPIRDKTGPSRLLDMVEGRSKQVFALLVEGTPSSVAGRGGSRCHGRLLRLQKRCRRGTACSRRGDGSFLCWTPCYADSGGIGAGQGNFHTVVIGITRAR